MPTTFRHFPPLSSAGSTFRLYESDATGLRGLLMETGEPLCSLHVVLGTESDTSEWTHKDDGLPHTLEHAVFMGSELYPFKGVLDKLANRSLARGTNAWTATDHTCYTMTSAGHEGVLNLMPIYADHILYATLTDECFHTEVHHVTPEGEDKGVVYCEMQGRENNSGSLVDRRVLDLLYPSGGYSSETGGKMSNLRELTNAQVRRYHAEVYRPDNVMFVMSGTAGEADFLKALSQVEERILGKGFVRASAGPRPWNHAVAPMAPVGTTGVLTHSAGTVSGAAAVVPFPSEDESTGVVSMGWRGPKYEDQRTWAMLRLLWTYLTESAVSPLTKAFVEVDPPLCSRVGPADEVFTEGYHQVWFRDAKTSTIDNIPSLFFSTVAAAATDFDLERMQAVIKRKRRKVLEARERAPSDVAMRNVIEHFLYGPRGVTPQAELDSLAAGVEVLPHLAAAETVTADGWRRLISVYISTPPCAAVIGKPTASLAGEIAAATSARTAATVERLGEGGLAELARTLEAAVAHNERDIPEEYLTAVPIPSYGSVRGIPLLTIRGGTSLSIAPNSGEGVPEEKASSLLGKLQASLVGSKGSTSPYWCEWAHIDSAFVSVAVGIDTSCLTPAQRMYLPIYLDTAFKLPATLDDGSKISKDDFVNGLQADTVRYSADTGLIRGTVGQMLSFFVQVELDEGEGLAVALRWIRRALYLTDLSTDLIKMAAQRSLSRVPAAVRDGPGIAHTLKLGLDFDVPNTNSAIEHSIRQQPFLTKLLSRLETATGSDAVLNDLRELRAILIHPSRMNIFTAADMTKLVHPYQTLAAAITPPPPPAAASPSAYAAAHPISATLSKAVASVLTERPADPVAAIGKFCIAAAAARSPPVRTATGPISDIGESRLLTGSVGQVVVCSLSAIESHFLSASAAGIGPYSEDHGALLVAIEYLTALEGDFWVKLRGAGLTYSYSIRPSTDTTRISFVLFKCADMIGAYKAAKAIVADYASGASTISQVSLDGAKSTVAYSAISATSTRLSAAAAAWESTYQGRGVDYGKWLLRQVDAVTVADALHALKRYIVPLFDPSANLAVTCPVNKLDACCEGLEAELGVRVRRMGEDALFSLGDEREAREEAASGAEADDDGEAPLCLPVGPPPSKGKGGGFAAFSFAKQFKCECPKCEKPAAPAL